MDSLSQKQTSSLLCLRTSPVSVSGFLGGIETLSVPDFQRAYSWGEQQVQAFLVDVERCRAARLTSKPKQHFFGAIVSCSTSLPGTSRPHFILVDGQQRVATLFMLIVCLRLALEGSSTKAEQETEENYATLFRSRAKNLHEEFEVSQDIEFAAPKAIRKLMLCKADDGFFGNLIGGLPTVSSRASHLKIETAFGLIKKYVFETILERAHTSEIRWNELDALYKTFLNDWSIVHLSSDDRSHANLMFRVLNARGIRATNGELLRARTLESVAVPLAAERFITMVETWDEILSGEFVDPDQALDLVYQSISGSTPSHGSVDIEFDELFFPELNSESVLTEYEAQKIFSATQSLRIETKKVSCIAAGKSPFDDINALNPVQLSRLEMIVCGLGQTDAIPLLLAAAQQGQVKFVVIADIVERFLFRYSVICKQPMSKIGPTFRSFAIDIRSNVNGDRSNDLRQAMNDLINIHADDELFREQLRALKYKANPNKTLKYLLIMLEQMHRWVASDNPQGFPKCQNQTRVIDFSSTTIEHIEARNAVTPIAELQPVVNHLGNLTILSGPENDDQGNLPFEDKRQLFRDTGYGLNVEVANLDAWNIENYNTRTAQLIDRALKIFSFNY